MSSACFRSSRTSVALLLCASAGFAQNPATTVSVDAKTNQHPISSMIYGMAAPTTDDLKATGFTMNREGGNGSSTYNWQIDATNHANDWYYETFLDPTYDSDNIITWTRAANVGAQALLTMPMLGYLGNLGPGNTSLWSFSIKKYGPQTGSDPYQPDAGNGISTAEGNPFITGNNPLEANIPNSVSQQQSWVEHLIGKWGNAAAGGQKYYIMDNEPSLWSSTHRDVHPNPETYDELYNDYVSYAGALRALDPNAIIVGPEEWNWWALFTSGNDQKNGIGAAGSDYNTHSQTYYYPWLLQKLAAYQKTTGNQLLNVLSVHYYPQEGSLVSNSDDDSLAGQTTRNQSTRALWDPSYVDPSWLNQLGLTFSNSVPQGAVNLIPTLKSLVSQYYPGLQTAITEYNWGDEANLNGATTQADALGIFGREGLDIATRWTVPLNPSPTYLSLAMYRNYDGKLSVFGDTSVSAAVANPDNLSSFAAVRTSDGALTVMVINKQQGTTPVTVSLANFPTTGTAQGFQIASSSQTAITALGSVPVVSNAISVTLPSQSITLFVIPAGTVTSKPSPPTGLAAQVGSGTVTVTWIGSGGATSYTVWRSSKSGSGYVSLGTVQDTSPLTLTDSGLTNGTTYYYVVTATNSAGTSLNSAELAATPIVPPTFTSSAAATPNPVTQGVSTTIKATVTCTANTLTNGDIQILVQDPNGNTAATQSYSAQTFAALQSQNYSFAFTPTIAGTYTVEIGAFSATWQDWYWNASAGTITVKSGVVFTSSASAPSTLTAGGTATISLTVTETGPIGLSNANIELQIFNASNSAVATQVWSSQNFAAGQSLKNSYSWTPAGSMPNGAYTVQVGVFDSTWSTDYYWNTDATITLSGSKPVEFTSAIKAPSTLVAGSTGALSLTVTETGTGSLTNGNVELQIYPASGPAVATQVWSSQSFTAGQKLSYTYNWVPAVALAPGSYTVDVGVFDSTWANDYYWNTDATITVTVPGSNTPQTITFNALSAQTLGSTPPPLSAVATSGLAVGFISNSTAVCTVSGVNITLVKLGTCSITASQPGNSTYAAATPVTRTFVVSAGPPAIVSLSPNAGAGTSATFKAVFSDPNGAADLNELLLQINTTQSSANACYVYYQPQGNHLYLAGTGSTWLTPALTPGVAGTASNSQCTLNAGSSSVTSAGNDLTVNVALSFINTFVDSRNVYLYAGSLSGQNSGWVKEGTWTPNPIASPPAIVSLTPNSGTGESVTFKAVYSDPNGAGDLSELLLQVNSGQSSANACYVYYQPQGNHFYLANNAGNAWMIAAPTASNNQCTLNAASSSITMAGNDLTVNVALTFSGTFAGAKNVYLYGAGFNGKNSGWVKSGAWTP
jgi:ABC-type uncharacterized transport system substrate-binding protein